MRILVWGKKKEKGKRGKGEGVRDYWTRRAAEGGRCGIMSGSLLIGNHAFVGENRREGEGQIGEGARCRVFSGSIATRTASCR